MLVPVARGERASPDELARPCVLLRVCTARHQAATSLRGDTRANRQPKTRRQRRRRAHRFSRMGIQPHVLLLRESVSP